jgi:DNA primase
MTEDAERFRRGCDPKRLAGLARSLGLSVESLTAFRAGWSGGHLAWTFPMSDPATGRVVGIRLRLPSGKKLSVKGGREGLFLPDPLDLYAGRLLIAEGPTDAAALLDMGFPAAVGRPSCTGGTRHLVALVRDRRPDEVVVLADADEPGRAGAAVLARDLSLHVRAVRVTAPPAGTKDARAWKIAGATRPDVEDLIRRTDPVRRSLVIRGSR